MITNERQYKITMTEIRNFENAINELSAATCDEHASDALAREIQLDAMRSQLADLRSDVSEYDDLRSGRTKLVKIESFNQLPRAIISARIAAGLTQADLAERLGIHEQQVQRYEATGYSSASMQRVGEVIEALGLSVHEEILMPNHDHSA
jgi:ribosome-binding protein aMBF1 (putative translation factor)